MSDYEFSDYPLEPREDEGDGDLFPGLWLVTKVLLAILAILFITAQTVIYLKYQ